LRAVTFGTADVYDRRRLWITFLRRFWGGFWGGFLEPTGPGASARGDFSPKDPRMLRWASADLVPFSTFFAFLARFLPVFAPYFALFPSMPCAYLYVNNYFSVSLARDLHSLQRRGRRARRERRRLGKGDGETARPSTQRATAAGHGRSRTPARGAVAPWRGKPAGA